MTLRELAARIAAFVTRRHGRSDLDDQLQFHREMLEEQLRSQGLTSADAAREARRRIGGPAQIGVAWQDQRSLPWLETLIGDLRFGARMLVRAPGFSLAALFTLTLGIGANTAMFTIVDAVLLRPLPYVEPERLVTIGDRNAAGLATNVDFTTVADWRARSRSFESAAGSRRWWRRAKPNGCPRCASAGTTST